MKSRELKYLRRKKRQHKAWMEKLARLDCHDMCTECGKRTDGLMNCYIDGLEDRLCPECMEGSGYCLGCGQFWAGATEFDFSRIEGYCPNCVDEIESNYYGDDDEGWDGYPGPDDLEPDPDAEYGAYCDRQREEELESVDDLPF